MKAGREHHAFVLVCVASLFRCARVQKRSNAGRGSHHVLGAARTFKHDAGIARQDVTGFALHGTALTLALDRNDLDRDRGVSSHMPSIVPGQVIRTCM